MPVLDSSLDPRSSSYLTNFSAMQDHLAALDEALALARKGGGDKYVTRHHARGKLLARERIELLVDRDTPFLELCPFAGYGSPYPVGGSVVIGLGLVEGSLCVIVANDPTVRGGALNPHSLKKTLRATEIARTNRLPLVNLVESGGIELACQAEIFVPGGEVYREIARLSADGVPTVAAVFGDATASAAYAPAMCDYTVFVKDRAKVFLAGPQLVRMTTGGQTDDESLGGAAMHGIRSGLADFVAEDERDAIRLARMCVARAGQPRSGRSPMAAVPPKFDVEDLLAVASADPLTAFDPREVLARVLDGSGFDEFKPAYGTAACTGWGSVHGHRVAVVANARGVLYSQDVQKAAQFVQLANSAGTPLIFLQNTSGYPVGAEHEQAGLVKHGAALLNAVANAGVPRITVNVGACYGAGSYAMCGRGQQPNFLFSWPNARTAVLGPEQLAATLSVGGGPIGAGQVNAGPGGPGGGQVNGGHGGPGGLNGGPGGDETDAGQHGSIVHQIEQESTALAASGRLLDDGVIDPRDTRTVLGMCLAAVRQPAAVAVPHQDAGAARRQTATAGYGVFRM